MTEDRTNGVRDMAESVADAARERAEVVREALNNGLDETYSYLKRQVQERPLAVLGVAAGIGVLIGLALSKGRR